MSSHHTDNGYSDPTAFELAGLRKQIEAMHQEVRARDDFIAIAAHELREPMTAMLGAVDLALSETSSAGYACPPRISVLLVHLERLIQDYADRATRLLEVSRVASGNLQLEPSVIDISALLRSVALRYEACAADGGSIIELDIKAGIFGTLDRLAFEQVTENLLSNALKFGSGKPVTVRLWSDRVSATLQVQDRGIGIPPDQQANIFGRFEQAVAEHRDRGFGIGLWVAHRLVAAMGGRIGVASSMGAGSIFTVTLPLSRPGIDRLPLAPLF